MICRIKESLLDYHRAQAFKLYDSFPLVGNDPTVLFTNATITPFKHFFEDGNANPHNYALVQQCLRVGGGAGDLDTARVDPNYSSLFEMFGSGLFGYTITAAVEYFLEMLIHVGLQKENLRFTVPEGTEFAAALLGCGVSTASVFTIKKNGEFWQEWRFGRSNIVGKGLTAIYACDNAEALSVDEMASNPQSFVEIGNLIHIYERLGDGQTTPIFPSSFDVGIGVERLAIVMENKTLYQLDSFRALVDVVTKHLKTLGINDPDQGTLRIMTDHIRVIDALAQEGLTPGNKKQAFVLRKLIRSLLETLWIYVGDIISVSKLIHEFAEHDTTGKADLVTRVVCKEERSFREILRRGKEILRKNPLIEPDTLKSTHGVRQSLLPLLDD